ncbi:MAG TPA: zinc finger protein [Pseudonocardiaceae bacterium]|nr:zinc finger protein [Pseudonocardiaceae bacterium]
MRKRWVECADARHAIDGPPACPGEEVVTLCGKSSTVVVPAPGMYAPECSGCDRQWRAAEGIPQREEHHLGKRKAHQWGRRWAS